MRSARGWLIVLLVAAAAWMAWLAVYQVDDAFIVYRYARNLARGDGFVFNLGERVEGVTCFLWTLLLTPFYATGLSLPRIAPILTAIAGLTCLVVVAWRHAENEGRVQLAWRDLLAPAMLAVMPAFAYWSVGALETVPYALLVTLAARAHARETNGAAGHASAIWLGIACLVRPETPLVVAALAIERAWTRGLAATVKWLSIIAAFFVPFLLFRRFYFGDWLSNTYYAKTGARLAIMVAKGWQYTRSCLELIVPSFGRSGDTVVILGVIAIAALLAFAWRRRTLRTEAIVVLAFLAATIVEGGDWMVLSRFWVPALPCLAVIIGAALLQLSARGRVGMAVASLLAVAIIGNDVIGGVRARNGGQGLLVNAIGYQHAHMEIGRYLNEHGAPGDAVALMDIGMIGWVADRLRVIDITGLTDREIAHAPGGIMDKHFPVYDLLARNPRFIVLVPHFRADDRIFEDPAFRSRYTELFKVDHRFNWTPPSSYEMSVYERKAQ